MIPPPSSSPLRPVLAGRKVAEDPLNESVRSCVSRSSGSVGFSTVEFHEHAIVLGDNPSTSCGPSLEIDWTEQYSTTIALDDYEGERRKFPRRPSNELKMPVSTRRNLLLENGYTMREIMESTSLLQEQKRRSEKKLSSSILKQFWKKNKKEERTENNYFIYTKEWDGLFPFADATLTENTLQLEVINTITASNFWEFERL